MLTTRGDFSMTWFIKSLIETKVTANWSKKISLYNHFIVLTVLSVWFFGYKMTNQLPICTKTKEKTFFWKDNLSARGWKNPPLCCTSIRLDAWVGVAKTLFSFSMKMTLQNKKNTEFMFSIIVFQKSGLPN